MKKNIAVARRYAKALLLIGKENGEAQSYRREIETFTALLAYEKDLERAISNPVYQISERKRLLGEVVGRLELSDVMRSFLLFVFDKGRIGYIHNICEFYQRLADELQGIVQADLLSATELAPEAIDKIRQALSDMTGKQVALNVRQDTGLIGGIVTKIGDLVLDGSVKTQLLNMRESLKRGENV